MNFGFRFVFIFLFCCMNSSVAQQVDSLLIFSYEELKNQYLNFEYTNPNLAQKYAQAS